MIEWFQPSKSSFNMTNKYLVEIRGNQPLKGVNTNLTSICNCSQGQFNEHKNQSLKSTKLRPSKHTETSGESFNFSET